MSKIQINGLNKPENCFDCPFLSESMHVYVPNSPPGKHYYEAVWKCKLAPDKIEDPWRGYEYISKNIEPWCPIKEIK